MNWLTSILIALLTGVLGLLSAGGIAGLCVRWYRISSFEGKSGYFIILLALLGGVAGLVLGLVAARWVAAGAAPGFLKGLGCAWGVVLALALLASAICHQLADIPPTLDGRELTLEIELRLPAGSPRPIAKAAGESYLLLFSVAGHTVRKRERGELRPEAARVDSGRWIIPGAVPVFTQRGGRSVGFQLNGESVQGFGVPLPARPGHRHEQWSDWLPRPPASLPPWPDSKASYRFRVQPVAEPEPGPTRAALEAQAADEEANVFRAIASDAPIAEWFPYTQQGAPAERRAIAIRNLTAKPGYAGELAALMVDANAENAVAAQRLVADLPQPAPDLIAPVTAAGREIAALLRRVNATPVEQDPRYLGAAEVSMRFNAWMEAVRILRAGGTGSAGDFLPELKEILVLSRVRNDSLVLRGDVRRVASYYAKEWAGLAPLPDDPPPK